jgi:hypothetical protein
MVIQLLYKEWPTETKLNLTLLASMENCRTAYGRRKACRRTGRRKPGTTEIHPFNGANMPRQVDLCSKQKWHWGRRWQARVASRRWRGGMRMGSRKRWTSLVRLASGPDSDKRKRCEDMHVVHSSANPAHF